MSILSTRAYVAKGRSPNLRDLRRSMSESAVPDWQTAMRRAIRSNRELCRWLELEPGPTGFAQGFPVFVPLEFLARIEAGNDRDPLLLQVMPTAAENESVDGFTVDPLNEVDQSCGAGLIQKYAGRALLVTTDKCPVHCRYCFRRHFQYDAIPPGREGWQQALAQLRQMRDVEEVLLSGGDPLSLGDGPLCWLIEQIGQIPHVRRLRLHTRFPIMIPQRITDELVHELKHQRLTTWVVVHVNHAKEIDSYVCGAIGKLVDAGIPVLNQAVLLRGVNDDVDTLVELSKTLIDIRVVPYYLHQLDQVAGAARFQLPIDEGKRLVDELYRRLPGYAVPRYVCEQPGQPAKTRLL